MQNSNSSIITELSKNTEKLLDLYNTLSGNNLSPDTLLELNTLSDVPFMDGINYMSFLIGDTVAVLTEQSEIDENTALRMLLYIARVYRTILDYKFIYRRKLVSIPKPRFWVLYNGDEPISTEKALSLSDTFLTTQQVTESDTLSLEIQIVKIDQSFDDTYLNFKE